MNSGTLTEGNVSRALLRFAVPFLVSSFLQQLYATVDMIAVGKLTDPAISAAEQSAVSVGAEVAFCFTCLAIGLAAGGTVLIGQYIGAKQPGNIRDTIGTMFPLFGIVGLLLTLVMVLGAGALVDIMQVPEAAKASARQYLAICGAGMIFVTGFNMVGGILRGMGDSASPMVMVMIACVINVIGDIVLVGPLAMGATGAAVATISAQACSFLFSLVLLRKKHGAVAKLSLGELRLRRKPVGLLLRLGIPISAQDFLIGLSFMLITAFVNRLGLNQSAAVGVIGRVSGIAMLVSEAFMSAIAVMAAQCIGSGDTSRAQEVLRRGMTWAFCVSFAAFVLIQIFLTPILTLFTNSPGVIAEAALYLRSFSFDIALVPFVFCLNGFFTGCGHTGFCMFNNLLSTFLVRVGGTLLITLLPGTTMLHIGIAAPACSAFQIILEVVYYRLGRWKQNTVLE